MKVPCPLPLQSPWSPVGYRILEVGEEHVPTSPTLPRGDAAAKRAAPAPNAVPRSPVGCRVVQVAEEKVPRPPRPFVGPHRPSPSRQLPYAPLLVGGAF